jgi:hypothetical protein
VAKRYRLYSGVAVARRYALRKGASGSRAWLYAGGVLWLMRAAKLAFGRQEEFLGREKLVAGQFVRVESIRPLTRKERKALKRAR